MNAKKATLSLRVIILLAAIFIFSGVITTESKANHSPVPIEKQLLIDPGRFDPASLQQATNTPGSGIIPISAVLTITPNEDGSITHIVKYGETLIDIAQAYGLTLNELYALNRSLDPARPVYYEGQVLIIRSAFTLTPFITETHTPRPPTNTPRPTRTPHPTYTPSQVHSPVPTDTLVPTPPYRVPTIDDLGQNRQRIAYIFIITSVIGLVVLIATTFNPWKKG